MISFLFIGINLCVFSLPDKFFLQQNLKIILVVFRSLVMDEFGRRRNTAFCMSASHDSLGRLLEMKALSTHYNIYSRSICA